MKSKTKKSDKKSTASRGQGSTQHRLTSGGVRTSPPPPPPHETTLSTAVVSPDASPLPGGQSRTVRIASKTLGRKSCEPTGNGHSLKEGSEVTGSEPVGTSVASVGGSDTAPEVVEEPEMKQRMVISVEGSGSSSSSNSSSSNNHQTPPTKRMKMMMSRETQPSSSSSLSSAERCNAGVLTDPDCLGPCDPGSSVILEGIVWNESRNGLLVVNVTWRGKTYVGTLMDSTNHNWASPSFKEDSLSTDNNSSSRDEDGGGGGGVAMAPEGRRLRRCRTMQPSNGVMTSAASSATSSSSASTTSTTSSKTSTTRTTKCRVQVGDNSVQTDPVNNPQQTLNGNGSDAGILCPELHCQRKFKHESALRNHRFRAHKATDSIATSATFATSSAVAVASATSSARSIVDDDSVGSALTTAQSKGPSLLLQAKQRSFDGDEDVSSSANAGGGRGIKKTEDGAPRLGVEKDGGGNGLEAEEDCSAALIKSASGMMENNKLDCFVRSSSRCLQSTPIICSGLLQMSSCAKLASSAAEMENGTGDAALDSSDCLPVSDSAVPMRDGGECIAVCADRQKMRNGAKKDCKGRPDRVQKHSETVVASSAGLASQMFGQLSTAVGDDATSAAAGASAGALSLQSSEDKHCAKRLKTNGGMPFSMLSVSLNRIPIESESSLARKTVPATETRSDDRSQDAEKTGSSCNTGVDSVRGLGLDVAKLCIVSGFGSGPGREPSAGKTPSQSLFAMREVMGRYPAEKTQVDNSNCHPVLVVKTGSMHTEEITKPQLESCVVPQGRGQNGSDCQTSSDRALTPSKPGFQSSKTCHDKLLAPGIVRDGNQKQTGLHSGSSFLFATDSSKSLLDHKGKESMPVSHLSYVDKTKPELCTSSAKGIQTSTFSLRNSTGESIGSQTVRQKICPSFSNPDLAITDHRGMANSAVSSGGSGPTLYPKDMMMNSFTNNVQKDFSDLKGAAMPSRSAIPFAVPIGSSRSLPNGSLTWTTSPFVSSMSSLQHTTTTMMRSNASSDPPPPPTSRGGSTYVTALAASMSSSLTADCSFVPFCRAIQGAPATTPLPKQMNKFCAPLSPPLSSCPLEANTASEVFVRRIDDGLWTSAAVGGGGGKSAQHATTTIISNSSCPDRNVLVCADISLPLPLQPPPSSSSTTDLHHGGGGGAIPYQQKKEKLVSTLHSSAMKPTQSSSTSSRSLLTGHSVQAACPK